MNNKNDRRRSQRDGWWLLRTGPISLTGSGVEDRERGPEAEARHRAYVRNAYATLAPNGELLRYGALAGLQVGATLLAIETALLIALLALDRLVSSGGLVNLYGATPFSGTSLEPLWPVALSLPALPLFAAIGAGAALARRYGSLRRRALEHYFSPVSPRLDFLVFWLSILATLLGLAQFFGILFAQADPTGVLTLALAASGLVAWPSHHLWMLWYLPQIEARGSVSREEISARIQQQL